MPKVLTAASLILSLCALLFGLVVDGKSFAVNVSAALFLLGPGLLVTNIFVKAVQNARARERIRPLLLAVNEQLFEAFSTATQAFKVLELDGQPAIPSALEHQPDFAALASALTATRSVFESRVAAVKDLAGSIGGVHPLELPQLNLVSRLIQQADRHHQMPFSVVGAVVAEVWADTQGARFIYGHGGTLGGMRHQHVGFSELRQQSISANPTTTGIFTSDYLLIVDGCLLHAGDIALKLANEVPPRLF